MKLHVRPEHDLNRPIKNWVQQLEIIGNIPQWAKDSEVPASVNMKDDVLSAEVVAVGELQHD